MISLLRPRRSRAIIATATLLIFIAAFGMIWSGGAGLFSSTQAACGPVDGGPGVATDQEDYQPNETVIVTGCAMEAYNGQTLVLRITRPDGVFSTDPVTIASGGFTFNYVLNGIVGTYTVEVLDGTSLIASTTFTDHTTSELLIDNDAAVTNDLPVTLNVSWVDSGGDPTQARFANIINPALGCPSNADPAWSAWMAITEDGTTNTDTFPWTLAAGARSLRKVCMQTGHGPLGTPDVLTVLTDDDTIWYVVANPPLGDSCGLDIVLVIDSSGSINSTELAQMKTAFKAFVSAFLPETPTEMAVVEFDTNSSITQAFTSNETSLNNAIDAAVAGGNTNWDDALFDARSLLPHRPTKPDLIVFASDGNPNTRGGHTDVGLGHAGAAVSVTEADAMDWATDEADEAKTDGARILGLGIGGDLDAVNMSAVTGNVKSPPAPIDQNVDLITTGFSTLADDLATLAAELCGGTITVHKIIDGDGNTGTTGDQTNGANWTFSTNVDPPDNSTPPSGDTDVNGQILFDISTGVDNMATVDVLEPGEPGYVFVSASCTKPDGPDAGTDPDPVGTPATGAVNNIAVGKLDIITCTFYNTNTAQFVVNKNFVPDDGASVTVALVCTSGTVANDDTSASEADPANFTVTGFTAGTTCTATETVPVGYTANQAACQAVPISTGGTSFCTIINTLNTATFNVSKDFSDNSAAPVTISLMCTSGTVTVTDPTATEIPADTADFTITGFTTPATCTATETVPAGYTANQSACQNVAITPGGTSSCTIINTLNTATFNVSKDFSDNSAGAVTVSLVCTGGGTVATNDPTATEVPPDTADFTVNGFTPPATCTATENPVPPGYTANQAACQNVAISVGGTGSCTIVNTANTATFNVSKNFVPDSGTPVTITLTCTGGGTVTTNDPTATEVPADTADFTITAFTTPANCTATENPVPPGYTADQTNCQNVPITPSGTSSCTIIDHQAGSITIIKDAVPNDPQDFDFACSNLGVFSLDDDADGMLSNTKNFPNVTPGSYTCTEANEPGWQISISCNDPDGGTTVAPPTANIDVDGGENVTCTFTNTFTPGPPAVGGVLGLLDDSATAPHSGSRSALTTTAPATVLAVLLGAAVVWVTRRRFLG